MSDLVWLAAAFAIVWLVIGLYLVRIALSQRAVDRRIEELEKRSR